MTTKSVVSVAAIVGYNHCNTHFHRIKEALDVPLRYSSPCDFHILAKGNLMQQRVVYPGLVIVQVWITRFLLVIDRENKQAKEAIHSDV
ncbi:hypothetical protein TNCV_3033791 [Trichonephila clavipes]|nr:hypothetical protein TNCV_3033791 [Trichonephila clavipes]